VWVSANDRAGLERLCRYVLRPPFAQERLRLRGDGRVAVKLKMPWRDGTTELVFEPLEFLGKLAAITPRPKVNLIICHGLLAPHARSRRSVAAYGRIVPDTTGSPHSAATLVPVSDGAEAPRRPRHWTWAALMQRAFAIDVLARPRCGSRMRLIATIHDPGVIRRILAHLGLSRSGQSPGPAPPEPSRAAP
jgi:putative transposase